MKKIDLKAFVSNQPSSHWSLRRPPAAKPPEPPPPPAPESFNKVPELTVRQRMQRASQRQFLSMLPPGVIGDPTYIREPEWSPLEDPVLAARREEQAEARAKAEREERAKALAAGAGDYREKPLHERMARAAQLGVQVNEGAGAQRDPKLANPATTAEARQEAAQVGLLAKMEAAAKEGRSLRAPELTPDEFDLLVQSRGLGTGLLTLIRGKDK